MATLPLPSQNQSHCLSPPPPLWSTYLCTCGSMEQRHIVHVNITTSIIRYSHYAKFISVLFSEHHYLMSVRSSGTRLYVGRYRRLSVLVCVTMRSMEYMHNIWIWTKMKCYMDSFSSDNNLEKSLSFFFSGKREKFKHVVS